MVTILRSMLCIYFLLVGAFTANSAGGKRIVINKSTQTLTAYEGNRAVFSSNISTGRSRSPTPSGSFQVGAKERMHRSRLYNNAPMPYSVQFSGNYFIHGFSSVPRYPASHGCVRMPIGSAQRLFNWAGPGTSVIVGGQNKAMRGESKRGKQRLAQRSGKRLTGQSERRVAKQSAQRSMQRPERRVAEEELE